MLRRLVFLFLLFSIRNVNAQDDIDTTSFNSVFNQINFTNKNSVVIGEAHTISGTHKTELFIIDKLVERGYKTIYIEGGEAEACIMNLYLQTGDTALFVYTRARESTGSYKQFLKSLYALSKRKQFNFVIRGFDFENPVCLSYLFEKWFDIKKVENSYLKQQITSMLSVRSDISYLSTKQMNRITRKLRDINDSLVIFESEYKKILGENYAVFKNIISNPVRADFGTRNEKMKDLVLQRVYENELDKVIFITGNHHLYYSNKNFIPLLSKALPDDCSLTVFAFVYSNCRFYKSNTIYNSRKRFLKYIDTKENKNPLVFFGKKKKQIIPSDRQNIMSIVTGLYNQ